jgi:hypothetical protein
MSDSESVRLWLCLEPWVGRSRYFWDFLLYREVGVLDFDSLASRCFMTFLVTVAPARAPINATAPASMRGKVANILVENGLEDKLVEDNCKV